MLRKLDYRIFDGRSMLYNFSWVIANKLSGSNLPGRKFFNIYDNFEMINDISILRNKYGINVNVSLVDKMPLNLREECESCGIESIWFPILDYDIPQNIVDFSKLIYNIIGSINIGKIVNIHCSAGCGRTGMVLACIVGKLLDLNDKDAIKFVKTVRPCSIETHKQLEFIKTFLNYENITNKSFY